MSTYSGSGASSVGPKPGSSSGTSAGGGTADVARDQASLVGQQATQAGGEVVQAAKEQATGVANQATQQARDLASELRTQVSNQTNSQVNRLAATVRQFSDELGEMASASSSSGVAAEVARQASARTRTVADYLEQREPADLVDDVRQFASRRPGAFILGAALAGVVTGRLVKGATAGAAGGESRSSLGGTTAGGGTSANRRELPAQQPTYAASSAPPTPVRSTPTPAEALAVTRGTGREAGVVRSAAAAPLAETGPGTYGSPTSGLRPTEGPTVGGQVTP